MIIKKIIIIGFFFIILQNIFCELIVHKSADTLRIIAQMIATHQKGVYLRFGDGDVNLACGHNDLLQGVNHRLQKEMQEAFSLSGKGVLKTLPLHCEQLGGFESGMFPGNHEWSYPQCIELLKKVGPFWKDIHDVYAQAALHYAACYNFHVALRFLYFLSDKCFLLVGNQHIPEWIQTLLFGKSHFLPTPATQSYSDIDRIEKECSQLLSQSADYKVVVVAMGCSGRVLQKRLWEKYDNIFLFDFGSLMDALCGWDTRAWISLSKFNKDTFISHMKNKIKILYTAALIDQQYALRKQEYCHSLSVLASYHYFPFIADAVTQGTSFLDEYSSSVFYARSNDNRVRNKGVNEVRLLRASFDHFGFHDDDMIVKLTGRYYFMDDSFLKMVELHPTTDLFIKMDAQGQTFTGCYAMRARYIKEFINAIDLEKMEKDTVNIELLLSNFIKQLEHRRIQIKKVEQISLVANIFGNGECQMTTW